jgi:hypothetical protein
MSVGVMEDYKLRDLRVSHTLKKKKEVYYESIKREPKIRGIKKCRCDERLQTKSLRMRWVSVRTRGDRRPI